MEENKQEKGMSIASMVLGIVSCASIIIPWLGFFIGIATGVVGLVLAIMVRKQGATNTMMKVGLILSIVGISVNTLVLISCVGFIACSVCSAMI